MNAVPDEADDAVKALAEELLRAYDAEYSAGHLSWKDFAGQARELIEVVAPHIEQQARARVADLTASARARVGRAHREVAELAEGHHPWRMSIPAQPDRDSDLILSAGLDAGEELLTRVEQDGAALARVREVHSLATWRTRGGYEFEYCTHCIDDGMIVEGLCDTLKALGPPGIALPLGVRP